MAQQWGISREDQDALALKSHLNLAKAYEVGFFNDLMTPFKGVGRDNNLRADLTIEKLRGLKPVFDKKVAPEKGTLTAGNSTPLTDGASAVLLASEAWAKAHKIPVLAYLTFSEVAAVDFFDKKEGLLMAPAYAVPRMLARAGLSLQDFDYYEIHEAFAAQVLCTLKAWENKKFCKEKLGLDKPLGKVDPQKAQYSRQLLGCRPPLCRHGRTHCGHAGQDALAEGLRPRLDLDLCGGRAGCGGDCGAVARTGDSSGSGRRFMMATLLDNHEPA